LLLVARRWLRVTYCVGVLLDEGLVLASDSRTHAGVDNFATFCKMTVFERAGDRVIVLLSSGNLAGTQAVVSVLRQRSEKADEAPNLWNARTMFDVALVVSTAIRDIERCDGQHLQKSAVIFDASFIIRGPIKGEPMRLFRTFAEGNRSAGRPPWANPLRPAVRAGTGVGPHRAASPRSSPPATPRRARAGGRR
jgi:putative proteasome-type protease